MSEELQQEEVIEEAVEQEVQPVEEPAAEQDDEIVITIGDEPPPPEEKTPAPEWIRDLRKQHRELLKKNRELEDQLRAKSTPVDVVTSPGKKPTLEDCDYDAEKYEADLTQWYDRKRKAEEAEAKANAEREEQDRAWKARLAAYGDQKAALKVSDYDDAEAAVQDSLSQTQQGIIVQGVDDPAIFIYGLGKNPAKLKELAAITDPVRYAVKIGELKAKMTVTKRSSAPPPEKVVRGSGPISSTVDSHLDRLRAEAEKTGDYTKVTQYKMQKRKA